MEDEEKRRYYGGLRYELFEMLMPKMLYDGQERERDVVFRELCGEGQKVVFDLFAIMCREDGEKCPYTAEDFRVNVTNEGGIGMVEIILPPFDPEISDILKAFLMFSWGKGVETGMYFLIKRFKGGGIFLMYADREGEVLKVEEIPMERVGDTRYEHWRLVRNYAAIAVNRGIISGSDGSRRGRDWAGFNWRPVKEKLDKGEADTVLTEEEFLDYLDWLSGSNTELFQRIMRYAVLVSWGFPDEAAHYFSAHPKEIKNPTDRDGR